MVRSSQNANALPKYVQLSELLARDIDAGRLLDGERLPPEREMAATLGTSIGTLRKALAALENKGLLRRVQGSGNYIRKSAAAAGAYPMFRLELLSGGGLPSAEVLGLHVMQKPRGLPAFGHSSSATRIRRRRYLNDVAIAVEEIWLDAAVGVLDTADLSDSLYQTYLKQLHFWITRAEDRVSISALPAWTPLDFGHPRTACGYIERFSWADQPTAIEFSRTWFDTTKSVYVQRLK
ncbi:HTH-type transcriptional repressor NagR [Roseobacter fucihabitans]|uniref:HTH-type transcriptional repressor NagR n=1 Tax=Roseobacter fucihabitans TaxID=1537242 RepID=A0ABZ2BPZ4_9RHOB|nr:GntR family transcriptional regulator [Roseobacter litoralis]MBC6965539.1 HTH-type transcriptional repressor YvoA [Roseobacter litoralis]